MDELFPLAADVFSGGDERALGASRPADLDIVGYRVQAVDGDIGKVDEATQGAFGSYIIVDTDPWSLGKKILVPARLVNRVDDVDEAVYVDRTRDEIRSAPEFDERRYRNEDRAELHGSYGRDI
jgi:hypothetical protein